MRWWCIGRSGVIVHSESFYDEINGIMNGGIVLKNDFPSEKLPTNKLTQEEKVEREAWIATFDAIVEKIKGIFPMENGPIATTGVQMIKQRLIAQRLEIEDVADRSTPDEKRKLRNYPPKICAWTKFKQDVNNYQLPGQLAWRKIKPNALFAVMLTSGLTECRDEKSE